MKTGQASTRKPQKRNDMKKVGMSLIFTRQLFPVIDVGVSPKMNQGQLHKYSHEVAVFAHKHRFQFPELFLILPSDTIQTCERDCNPILDCVQSQLVSKGYLLHNNHFVSASQCLQGGKVCSIINASQHNQGTFQSNLFDILQILLCTMTLCFINIKANTFIATLLILSSPNWQRMSTGYSMYNNHFESPSQCLLDRKALLNHKYITTQSGVFHSNLI